MGLFKRDKVTILAVPEQLKKSLRLYKLSETADLNEKELAIIATQSKLNDPANKKIFLSKNLIHNLQTVLL